MLIGGITNRLRPLVFLSLLLIFNNLYSTQTPTYTPAISPSIDMGYYREFLNGQDSINWWTRLYAGLHFPEYERQAIFDYTFGHYFAINNKLRDGKGAKSLKKEKIMLSTLDKE